MLSCRVRSGNVGSGAACCRLVHRRWRERVARYPSDCTDAQWRLIDPLLPDPAFLTSGNGGRPEEWCRRDIVMRSSTWSTMGTSGGRCRPTFRPGGPSTASWPHGSCTGSPKRCWTVYGIGSGSPTAGPRNHRRPSSIPSRSRLPRPWRRDLAWVRCGQEDQRP